MYLFTGNKIVIINYAWETERGYYVAMSYDEMKRWPTHPSGRRKEIFKMSRGIFNALYAMG